MFNIFQNLGLKLKAVIAACLITMPILLWQLAPALAADPRIGDIVPCFDKACDEEGIKNLPQGDLRDEFIPIVVRFLIYGTGVVSFVVFFAAGVMLVISWGEEENNKKAKDMIVWGIVGLAVTGVSYAVVRGLLGLDFI